MKSKCLRFERFVRQPVNRIRSIRKVVDECSLFDKHRPRANIRPDKQSTNICRGNAITVCKVEIAKKIKLKLINNGQSFQSLFRTIAPRITVETAPPMKPSQVFFGESLMSGVLPKKNPNKYAITSLMTTIETGTMNQISPWNMFWMIMYDCVTTISKVTWVQANCENWYWQVNRWKTVEKEKSKKNDWLPKKIGACSNAFWDWARTTKSR